MHMFRMNFMKVYGILKCLQSLRKSQLWLKRKCLTRRITWLKSKLKSLKMELKKTTPCLLVSKINNLQLKKLLTCPKISLKALSLKKREKSSNNKKSKNNKNKKNNRIIKKREVVNSRKRKPRSNMIMTNAIFLYLTHRSVWLKDGLILMTHLFHLFFPASFRVNLEMGLGVKMHTF